jgi:hypothetical protein
MTVVSEWLPGLVLLGDCEGDWQRYLNALYEFFKKDFVESQPIFEGKRLGLKRHPMSNGKEATFWHMISEGNEEEERIPDLRRCERIRWPRPIIENSRNSVVKVWKNIREREARVCLWLEPQEYLVVLASRKGYILLWTAYVVDQPHRKRKLQKEFEEYCRGQAIKG